MHPEEVLKETLDIVLKGDTRRAKEFQIYLAKLVKLRDSAPIKNLIEEEKTSLIMGIDLSYPQGKALACAVTIKFNPVSKSYAILEEKSVLSDPGFPYIPGLLAFREIPAVAELMKKVKNKPDIVIFDGHGIAHPRKMGIATHFSLAFGLPSIGIAKKKLTGYYEKPMTSYEEFLTSSHTGEKGVKGSPGLFKTNTKNFYTELINKEKEQIGWVLKLKKNTKEIFVSPGSEVSLESSLKLALMLYDGYKLPAPTRLAHNLTQKIYKI